MQLATIKTDVLSNIQNTSTEFRISDMNLVMELLTKLYSNPIQTITQEYIANARDAHREINQAKQVQITAPSRFNSVMSIQDFGPGLSPDRIQNVFVYYGSSTKRATNTQNGGFGIGAKSAWAYTDSFTIVSRYDGVERIYVAHRSNAKGNLQLISETTTGSENGTTIQIAVRPSDVEKFRQSILRVVYFWKDSEKPELVGFTPDELATLKQSVKYTNADGRLVVYEKLPSFLSAHRNYAIIDGIPYPNRVGMDKLDDTLRLPYAIFLNTGEVTMLPSREEFTDDDKAKKFLGALDIALDRDITRHVNAEIAKCSTLTAGLRHAMELRQVFNTVIKYRGYAFDSSSNVFIPKDGISTYRSDAIELGTYFMKLRDKFKKLTFSWVSLNQLTKLVYDDMPNESAVKRMWRIRKLMATNGEVYLFSTNQLQIANDTGAIRLSSIDATDYKVNRTVKAAVAKQEICIHWYHGNSTDPKQVTLSSIAGKVVYSVLSDRKSVSNEIVSFISKMEGYRFGFIAEGSVSKVADDKRFISYDTFITSFKPTVSQVNRYLQETSPVYSYEAFRPIVSHISDKTLRYMVELAVYAVKRGLQVPKALIPENHPLVTLNKEMLIKAKDLENKYPLLSGLREGNMNNPKYVDDVINYLNSK